MAPVVVALVIQAAWNLLYAVLVQYGVATLDMRLATMSFAVTVATSIVIGAGMADLAGRLSGARRLGAWIASLAYFVTAFSLIVCEVLLHTAIHEPAVRVALVWMANYGWTALELLAIVGFAIAAGVRGAWFGIATAAVVLIKARPSFLFASWPSAELFGLLVVDVALIALMCREAELRASRPEPVRARAVRGMRLAELLSWAGTGSSAMAFVSWLLPTHSVALSIALACVSTSLGVLFVIAAWSIAQARVDNLPRWPWFAAAAGTLWLAARIACIWLITLAHFWGRLDDVKLAVPQWFTDLPAHLATIAVFASLAIYARRTEARDLLRATALGVACVVLVFVARVGIADEPLVFSAGYVIANIAAAAVYRSARHALEGPLPRARVV